MDIITSHMNADFDSFSSMVAAKRLYPDAVLVFPGSQEKKVRDFIEAFHPVEIRRIKDVDFSKIKRLIVVDTKSAERIGAFAGLIGKPGVKIHVYDHHPLTPSDIRGELEVMEPVGATVSILAEILKGKKIIPTPMEATIMGLGIYQETGNLLFPTTTERDVQALAFVLKCGASLKIIGSYLKTEMGRQELSVLNRLLEGSEDLIVHGFRIKIAKASMETYFGEAAQFAHSIMDIEEIDALVVMLAMEGKLVLIGRSRTPEINIAGILSEFGGGGHWAAASATMKETPFEIIEERLVGTIKKLVRPEAIAGDVMTKPVITIDSSSTVKGAEKTMTRYGVNVLPVLMNSKYHGIISREVVEKALFHGFGKSRVTDFTVTDAVTVGASAPIRQVEASMIERNQRFMPVLDAGGIIVGAITRTDILRVLYEDFLRRSHITEKEAGRKPQFERNLAKSLKERLPEPVVGLLKAAGQVADEMGFGVYMVGGSVRDIIRGQENLDIDLVVEGDAIVLSRELAARLNAKLRLHERFGTAHLILPVDSMKLDVATARTEYYESPAALPTVESSSIKKDLQRRDFTINTLAVKLNQKDFGLLVDFFGGRRDIRDKTIRVLHDLSFVEDPTRAFRAVRFAVRFGFRPSKHTEELLKSAVKMNLFERLSGSRLYEELLLIFMETEPVEAVRKLAEYGLLRVIHPALKSEDVVKSLASAHESLLWFRLSFMDETPDMPTLYLMAFLSPLEDEQVEEALLRLSASSRVKGAIMEGIGDARELLGKRLPLAAGEPAALYDAMEGVSLEGVLLAMSLAEDDRRKKDISRYLLELRRERPILNGNDLKAMGFTPGPVFSRILRAVLHERLKGRLKSRQDEERFVRELAI